MCEIAEMSYIINIVELKWLLVSLCGAVQLLVSCSVSYDVSDDDFPENLNEALSIIDSELQKKRITWKLMNAISTR